MTDDDIDLVVDIDVNDRIKALRDKYELKLKDIVDITGYSLSTIKKWMIRKGERSYQLAPIQALKLIKSWVELQDKTTSIPCKQKLADVITMATGKGGVGKTTLAFNLALILSVIKKKKVLACDGDPQGHLTLSLIKSPQNVGMTTTDLLTGNYSKPYKANDCLDVIGVDKSLKGVVKSLHPLDLLYKVKENLKKYREEYDYIIFDGIPTDSPWADAILAGTTKLVMPVTPDLYDSWGMQDVFDIVDLLRMRKVTTELKVSAIVANIVTSPMSTFDKTILENLQEHFPNEFCPTYITKSVKVKECKSPAICKSIVEYDKNSKLAKQYLAVTDFILNS